MLFFPLINVKMPTIVGIFTFMSRKIFMLNSVEHEKSFITSGPGWTNRKISLEMSSKLVKSSDTAQALILISSYIFQCNITYISFSVSMKKRL